jgi:hypothetical protein
VETDGIMSAASAWRTSAVFPTRRGPVTTWMNRGDPPGLATRVPQGGRGYPGAVDRLLNKLSKITQDTEHVVKGRLT